MVRCNMLSTIYEYIGSIYVYGSIDDRGFECPAFPLLISSSTQQAAGTVEALGFVLPRLRKSFGVRLKQETVVMCGRGHQHHYITFARAPLVAVFNTFISIFPPKGGT